MAKLLLVEDNPLNAEALLRLLTRRGFTLVHGEDGPAALRLAVSEVPDLILLDIGLPGMDGHEVARRLRADPATADIPIIALTAHATESDRDSALECGCDDFDVKPVDLGRLVSKIETLLARGAP